MSKFDAFEFKVQVGDEKNYANLNLRVLFEDGDDVDAVMADVKDRVKVLALDMKSDDYVKDIEQ